VLAERVYMEVLKLSRSQMKVTVSILAEIPEELHESLKSFLETHPAWDQDRVFSAALSLFLLQNGENDRRASRVYLDTLFNYAA
jgi:predicted TPR repeat methyltransferase